MAGTLYIVATPIGNLGDISKRALDVLGSVGAIACEDTRQTAKLLAHYSLHVPLVTYHQHSGEAAMAGIIERLRSGAAVALVSDAGTPGINDPGGKLVASVARELPDAHIVPIPGANAAITALSVSGFPTERFQYWGFVPHKKGRRTFFADLAACPDAVVFYESKHRITKALQSLVEAMPERPLVVARELTKQFETIYRGAAAAILATLGTEPRGEFVVVVAPHGWK